MSKMIYTDSDHVYKTVKTSEKYISVTTFIDKFTTKQDWNAIASSYMKKHDTKEKVFKDLAKKAKITLKQAYTKWEKNYEHSGDWIRSVWKNKSESALEGGTFFHNWSEEQDAKQENTIYNPIKNDKKYSHNLLELKPGHTYLELMLFLHKYKICGQADKVIINKNKMSSVLDYKTNDKEITPELTPFYNKKLGRKVIKRFLAPISNIGINDYWKYALQLSLYAYILEVHGYPPITNVIEHVITEWKPLSKLHKKDLVLSEDLELNRARVFVEKREIPVPYLRSEVIRMLEYYRQNRFKI